MLEYFQRERIHQLQVKALDSDILKENLFAFQNLSF